MEMQNSGRGNASGRQHGWGFRCGMFIGCLLPLFGMLLLVGGCSAMFCALFSSVAGGSGEEENVNERAVVEGGGERAVAMIRICGMITPADSRGWSADRSEASAPRIRRLLRKAQNDGRVAAVLLDMNTPGGEVVASDEIRKAVDDVRRAGKPVVTCIHSMGASGGYYIASGSNWIVANRLSITGSVGVIISAYQYDGLLGKIGVKPLVYRSGKFKDILSGAREMTPEEKAYIDYMVRQSFHEFCAVIAAGRPEHFADADAVLKADFANGAPLSGADALRYGLIDELGDFDAAVAKARELCGESEAPVIEYSARFSSWLDDFFSAHGGVSTVRVEGMPQLPKGMGGNMNGALFYLMPEAL